MNKYAISLICILSLLGAGVASLPSQAGAQTYGYYPSSCQSITSDLSVGSRGSQVLALQTFLVAQNYSGGGSWMLTGYYGQATAAAVRIFQGLHGVPQTGMVDSATRLAMCGGGYGNSYAYTQSDYSNTHQFYNYSYPYNYSSPYNYNTYYNTNYGCGAYPYYYPCANTSSSVTLTSMSPTFGGAGTQVTLYGTGFDYSGNNVYVGGSVLRNISSYDGTSLAFTMPANISGAVSVSVGNARSVSNALTFSAGLLGQGGYSIPWQGCVPGQIGYNYQYCPQQTGAISINYLSPNSGAVGTTVTVYGYGFSYENNSVRFGNGVIANLRSMDGRSLSFTIPSTLSGYGYQPIGLGAYDVSVANSYGATSNVIPFTITALGASDVLKITSVNGPTSLNTGQTGTWTINVQGQSGTYITASATWGDEQLYGYAASAPQNSVVSNVVTFSHSYARSGTYTVTFTVTNSYGQQNTSSITVAVSGSMTTNVSLSSLYPSAGSIGAQIRLQGSGFTSDNTVYFGIGGLQHVPSYEGGTLIYYTIPAYVSPCDVLVQGSVCPMNIQVVSPGAFPVKVFNNNGTSQTLYFQVQ